MSLPFHGFSSLRPVLARQSPDKNHGRGNIFLCCNPFRSEEPLSSHQCCDSAWRQMRWRKPPLSSWGREMRWLPTANFLRGSWLSSHASFLGVNKCHVQGWVGGYDNLLGRKHHTDALKRTEHLKEMERGGDDKSIKQANEIHLIVLCDETTKQAWL